MRFLSAFLITLFATFSTVAQNSNFACNYYGKQINESAICDMLGFRSRPEAIKAVNEIVSRSGLKQNFYVMECPKIDNCFAVVREGERLIIYDAAFMRKINDLTKTDWGAMSVLAHEIGHHLQGHTLKVGGSDQTKEIEADEFSGFVMYQMGASLSDAQSAIRQLTTDYDTGTHPPRGQRLGAIKRGFDNAKALYPSIQQQAEYGKHDEEIKQSEPQPTKEVTETSPNAPAALKVGCVNGNCLNGYGIAVNRYTKEKYAGGWDNGKRQGIGIEFYSNGDKKFEGEFDGSEYSGKGRYYFQNGDVYEGGFKSGQMNGELNVYYYKNGDRLFVKYIDGQKQGKAKIIFADGTNSYLYFRDDQLIKR